MYSRLSITRTRTGEFKSVRVIESNYRETLLKGLKNMFELWRFRVIEVRVIESLLYHIVCPRVGKLILYLTSIVYCCSDILKICLTLTDNSSGSNGPFALFVIKQHTDSLYPVSYTHLTLPTICSV